MSILKKQKFLLIIALVLSLLSFTVIFSPIVARAGGLVPCGGYNSDGSAQPVCNVTYAFSMVATVTNWLISLAGVYAVFQIVNAGFWLVVTMGNEEQISKYRKMLVEAVVGFVFVMLAFVLINTAVNFILNGGNTQALLVELKNPLQYVNSSPK
jgi:hypothetical protein